MRAYATTTFRRFAWYTLAAALAGSFLYAASYGPANSLVARGYLSPRKVDKFYRPIPEAIKFNCILHYWRKLDTRPGVGARD